MNMQNLMAQAQKMQKDIMQKKEEINKKEFVGKSQLVEIKFNGNKELISITIDKNNNIEKDDIVMLEDMIGIAIKDALNKIDEETEKALGMYGQSFNGLF